MANTVLNKTPSMQDKTRCTAQQIYSVVNINPNPKHWKPFGCPVYVLDKALQTGNIFHKWKQRSRVGIYVGQSPQRARNVALVLDRQTGFVSPQFHVTFDSSFHTIKDDKDESLWQAKAGFVQSIKTIKPIMEALPEALPKRVHFELSPLPEGAPVRTTKKRKQQSTNSTNNAPPEGAPTKPTQLQLPPEREKEQTGANSGRTDRKSGRTSRPVERSDDGGNGLHDDSRHRRRNILSPSYVSTNGTQRGSPDGL
jgi:hypothetical protein